MHKIVIEKEVASVPTTYLVRAMAFVWSLGTAATTGLGLFLYAWLVEGQESWTSRDILANFISMAIGFSLAGCLYYRWSMRRARAACAHEGKRPTGQT
jgi:hypothetical protein